MPVEGLTLHMVLMPGTNIITGNKEKGYVSKNGDGINEINCRLLALIV